MTARTSQMLADVLREGGLEDLAKRAEADEFHDYLSRHTLPSIKLFDELYAIAADMKRPKMQRDAAEAIRNRHMDGEFDADSKESEEWAASPEGQESFNKLLKGE